MEFKVGQINIAALVKSLTIVSKSVLDNYHFRFTFVLWISFRQVTIAIE
jgi:hypothetical protein